MIKQTLPFMRSERANLLTCLLFIQIILSEVINLHVSKTIWVEKEYLHQSIDSIEANFNRESLRNLVDSML